MHKKIVGSFLYCIASCFPAEENTSNIRRVPGYNESVILVSSQNTRGKTQQDRALHVKLDSGHLFAIFDGHSGEETVNYLYNNYADAFSKLNSISSETIIECYRELESSMSSLEGGSTSCSVYIPKNGTKAYFINLGDSQAYLFNPDGTIAFETNPHFPDVNNESSIIAKGGKIRYGGGEFYIQYQGKSIALSRSFGDFHFKTAGLISVEPDIKEIPFEENQFLLIGSDGFFDDRWDKVPQSIAKSVQEGKDPQEIMIEELNKAKEVSRDDITSILVILKALSQKNK